MKDAKTFWNKTAKRYAKSPIKDQASYEKKLAITREYLTPDSEVLEFGCGTGSTAILHAPHVAHILATDISDAMIAIGRERVKAAGIPHIDFQQGTLRSLNLAENRFDVVLGLNILHLLEDLDETLAEVHRVLKPGGVFISSSALVGDLSPFWRLLIPVMQWVGMAPYVASFDKPALLQKHESAGFVIEHQWQPAASSIFLVAKKAGG